MGGVAGDISKKPLSSFHMFYPGEGLVKKHIGTVAMSFLENAVVQDGGVKIRVAGRIAAGTGISLADASAAMDEDFVKTALVRSIGPFIPQMPFAENTCGITGRFEPARPSWPAASVSLFRE
jgi:hypothetical protein